MINPDKLQSSQDSPFNTKAAIARLLDATSEKNDRIPEVLNHLYRIAHVRSRLDDAISNLRVLPKEDEVTERIVAQSQLTALFTLSANETLEHHVNALSPEYFEDAKFVTTILPLAIINNPRELGDLIRDFRTRDTGERSLVNRDY